MTETIAIVLVVSIGLMATIIIMAKDKKAYKRIAQLEDTLSNKRDYIIELKKKVAHYETLIDETRGALAEVQLASVHRKRRLSDILDMIKEQFNEQEQSKSYQPPLISEEKTIL